MKVSVIVPVYNVEDYIEECIESILSQTLHDIEVLVIDDGGTDKSIEKVRKYKDKRLKIISQENKGLSGARNKGLEIAKGEYILFVDSDDYISDTAIEELYSKAKLYDTDVVVGNAIIFNTETKYLFRNLEVFKRLSVIEKNHFIYTAYLNDIMKPPVWLNMYKREFLIENNLFFEEGILHEDELFTPQMFLKCKNVAINNKPHYYYRQRNGSIMNSNNDKKRANDMIYVCNKLFELYDQYENSITINIMKDKCLTLYLYTIKKYNISNIKLLDRIKSYKYAKSFKNKIKSLIFIFNNSIYLKLSRTFK